MYYKVLYKDNVIDVLDRLVTLKYSERCNRMVLCDKNEAQVILSSDSNVIWHLESLPEPPSKLGYDTVSIESIDKYEYEKLKALNGNTPEEIVDGFVMALINNETGLFADSLHRLYSHQKIDESTVIKLCKEHKIAEDDKSRILK